MKRKKGFMSAEQLLGLVILGVILYFLWPFMGDLWTATSSTGKDTACTVSLINGGTKAACPISTVKIMQDKIEITELGGKPKEFSTKATDASTRTKETMAKLLTKCMTLGGGPSSSAFSRANYLETERVCLQCFIVTIQHNIPAGQLLPYLEQTVYWNGKTYLGALTKDADHKKAYLLIGDTKKIIPSNKEEPLQQGKEYTVIFLGHKKGELPDTWDTILNINDRGFVKGYLQTNDQFFTYVVETSNIPTVCQRLVN